MLVRMLTKKLFSLVLLISLSMHLYGQTGTIRGTVYEKESGEPSFGTNVKIKGTGIGASTDINGFYQINKLKPGKITLEVSNIEFNTIEYTVEIVANKIKTQNKYTPKVEASTADFECIKCMDVERKKAKQEKRAINSAAFTQCTYYQLQTRSADEPMTTFVTCLTCNARWKQ